MIKLSNFPIKTLKTRPKISDNISTGILLQAGFIRQTMAGVYNYTTLGLKVLRNIENIIREEMDNYGASEVLMSGLSPMDIWEKTGRADIEEYFKVPTYGNKYYRLNPTHEEVVTPLMSEFINSYKDSRSCVYQIQNKYRNEKRAKSGLLRGREFLMKDAYSFHLEDEEFVEYYEGMKKVYMKIFDRLGLLSDTYITLADGGAFTDKYSHEFQVVLPIGEDTIYIDDESLESFNQEICPSKVGKEFLNTSEKIKDIEEIYGEGMVGVFELSKFLNIEVERTTKTMIFQGDEGKIIAAAIRGDYNINTIKLRQTLGLKSLELASKEVVKEVTGCIIGYAGMLNLRKDVIKIWDNSCENRVNFEMGANKEHYHSINVNFGKDLELPEQFYDFKNAKEGDKNPKTGNVFRGEKASEVGNIFPLETKFSSAFGMKMLDKNNKEQEVIMGCYGIGISRLMGVIAEYNMTEKGIAWPDSVAPADYYIIVIGEDNLEKANQMAEKLEAKGKSIILDDRMGKKFGFGQKAGDCELFGIPNRVIISPKTVEQGGFELTLRGEESQIIKF